MKRHFTHLLVLAGTFITLAVRADATVSTNAAAAKLAVPIAPPKSVFTIPTVPREGRDPFYPDSTRIYDLSAPVAAKPVVQTILMVKGYSVVNGRPMVILNNHSFMTGDEGDVTSGGTRTHVHCLEIRAGTVIVEVNGLRQTIHF